MAISAKGLQKLGFVPQVDFFLKDDSDGSGVYMEWVSDKPQPTKAEIESAHNEWKAEYDTQEYARKRQGDYPDWGAQFNKIYDDGLTKWKAEMVDPVKAKWPKDNSGPIE